MTIGNKLFSPSLLIKALRKLQEQLFKDSVSKQDKLEILFLIKQGASDYEDWDIGTLSWDMLTDTSTIATFTDAFSYVVVDEIAEPILINQLDSDRLGRCIANSLGKEVFLQTPKKPSNLLKEKDNKNAN